jgi:hypothetical protein
MTDRRPEPQATRSPTETLALVRLSRWLHLSQETLTAVRAEVASALGLPGDNADPRDRQNNLDFNATTSSEAHLSLRIRQMMMAGASWHTISDLLWEDYSEAPSLHKAARILETAFVQAAPGETIEVFKNLLASGSKEFYWLLHPKLRDFLVEHAPEQSLEQLYWLLAKERNDTKLSGIEQTYIFLRVATTSDKTAAWMYFRRHQTKILDSFGCKKYFGMTRNQLIFRAGELALTQGYTEDARELFLTLPSDSPERETALQLILRFESHTVDRHRNSYFVRVESTQDWRDRIQLISSFCDTCRQAQAIKDPNRPALDILVASILRWLPKSPDAWRQAGDLIIRHRDLAAALPGLFKTFVDQSVVFHGPDIDGALWAAALQMQPTTTTEKFIQCVGLLHRYVTNPRVGERNFWQAYTGLIELERGPTAQPWACRDLLKTANQWINQTSVLNERERKRACATMRLALEGPLAKRETFETYMDHCDPAPESLLHLIARAANEAGDHDYATNVLIKSGLTRSFANRELLDIWTQAAGHPSPDLAWRVATALAARDALPATIKHTWEISGEKRTVYTPINLNSNDIDSALSDLSVAAKRLARALCILGQRINELAHFNNNANQVMPPIGGTSTVEIAIFDAVKNSSCLPAATKTVIEVAGIHMIPASAVALSQAIINSPWLFAVRLLAQRLSIPSWGWNLSTLQHQVKNILPLVGKDATTRADTKITKWISSMSSQERMAWNDIMNCSQDEIPEIISNDILKFVCRLALIVYPGHFSALKTAQQIRLHLDIIRDMEWFLLSEALTNLRSRRGILTRVAIPQSLKRSFT